MEGGGAWTAERGPRRRLNKTAGRRIERLLLEGRTEEAQTLGWAGDESELDLLLGRLDGTYDVECVLDKRHGELGLLLSTRHGSAAVQDVVPGSAAERDGTLRQGDVVCEVNGRVVLRWGSGGGWRLGAGGVGGVREMGRAGFAPRGGGVGENMRLGPPSSNT